MIDNSEIKKAMREGILYQDMEQGLPEERMAAKLLQHEYNMLIPNDMKRRSELMEAMFSNIGKNSWIESPIRFSYGTHIHIGDHFYSNFNLTLIDDAHITIGNNVLIGPNVVISTAGHPENTDIRHQGYQYSKDITIEDGVWIGAQVVVLPGVRIGKNSIIGAGSVVTKDIPENVVAYGVPCRVIRNLDNNK